MPQTPCQGPPTRQSAGSKKNLDVLITLLEHLDLTPADNVTLASMLVAKSLNPGSVPVMSSETTAQAEPISSIPVSMFHATPSFPSSFPTNSGADSMFLSSPSSTNTFGLSSSLGSSPLPLTLAVSPTSEYIDELLGPTLPISSKHKGPTTPIAVTIFTLSRCKPTECVIHPTDLDYEEVLALFADECFLQQFHGCYYNVPAVVDPMTSFYCMTKGTHIGIFDQWDQAAAQVLGVSGTVQYRVNSLDAGL